MPKVDLQQLIREAAEIEARDRQNPIVDPRYESLLKEICERDPINSHFVTQYADLMARKRVAVSPENAEEKVGSKGNEIEEA